MDNGANLTQVRAVFSLCPAVFPLIKSNTHPSPTCPMGAAYGGAPHLHPRSGCSRRGVSPRLLSLAGKGESSSTNNSPPLPSDGVGSNQPSRYGKGVGGMDGQQPFSTREGGVPP